MLRPSIRQLSYLIAIEDTGSFSAAAEYCGVTQSTLSAGIKELETILGQQLILRGHRQAVLTPFGEETIVKGRAIIKEADALMVRSKMLEKPMSGPMRLGIIPTIAPYMLPLILPRISKDFPDLELQLHEDLTSRLLEKLERSELDLILMAFPYNTPGMTQHPIFREEFLLACPVGFMATSQKSIKSSDLSPDKLLLLEDGHCLREHALEACGLQSRGRKKTFSATSLPTLLEMVRHGYGVTLLPAMAASAHKGQSGMALLPFSAPKPTREIGLIWPRSSLREADFKTLSAAIARTQKDSTEQKA